MSEFSLITIAKNRKDNLLNLLKGVERGTIRPSEAIVVSMDDHLELPDIFSFPIRIVKLKVDDNEMLPIAKARNIGASTANHDILHFLDVDCIPAKNYLMKMNECLQNGLEFCMGTPYYMTKKLDGNLDESFLLSNSIPHPARPEIRTELVKATTYSLFWSLCFSIRRKTFNQLDRFHEDYLGYGAEDTDFAFKAEQSGIDFYFVNAKVFHQQHAVATPPYHHMNSIVRNCNIFYQRWGIWPMDNWLQMFSEKKLIDWSKSQSYDIKIQAKPTQQMVEEAFVEDAPFA